MTTNWKKPRFISDDYRTYIKTLSCIVCGSREVTAHHWITVAAGGSDLECVPLCLDHHTLGGDSFHRLGVDTFAKKHKIDIDWIQKRLLMGYIEGREKNE